MDILLIGLVVFFGMHLIPAAPQLHASLTRRFGVMGWKGVMAVVSIAGFVMIVTGWQQAGYVHVYDPPGFGHDVTRILMLPALILLVAAYLPNNLKRFSRHPMLWGTVLWSVGHLFANGDLRSLVVFGAFLAWAFFDMWSCNRRGAQLAMVKRNYGLDVAVVVIGAVLYFAAAHLHGHFTGVSLNF